MKFLTICILALVATSYAGKLNVKRGLLGGEESLNQGYSSGLPSGPQFNPALAPQPTFQSAPALPTEQSFQPSAQTFNAGSFAPQPTFQSAQGLSAEQSFQQSEPLNNALPSQALFLPSQGHGEQQLPAGRSLDASYQTQLPQQNYLPPNQVESKEETIRAVHTHSVERFAEPVQFERTVYKKIAIDRPVPQPYEVIKRVEVPVEKIKEIRVPFNVEKVQTVKVPYEVERIKEIVKTVQVPQPYSVEKVNTVVKEVRVPFIVYRDVVKPVTVERLVPQPYEVVKTLERQVPFYVHQKPQITVTQQQVVHQVAQPVLHTVTQQKVLHEVSQPQIVHQQPIVHEQFLSQQQFVHQPLAQQQLVHQPLAQQQLVHQPFAQQQLVHQPFAQQQLVQHAEHSAAPVYGYPQQAQFVANAALPQPQW